MQETLSADAQFKSTKLRAEAGDGAHADLLGLYLQRHAESDHRGLDLLQRQTRGEQLDDERSCGLARRAVQRPVGPHLDTRIYLCRSRHLQVSDHRLVSLLAKQVDVGDGAEAGPGSLRHVAAGGGEVAAPGQLGHGAADLSPDLAPRHGHGHTQQQVQRGHGDSQHNNTVDIMRQGTQ